MAIVISPKIRNKLAKKSSPVSSEEIEQCFVERKRSFLVDGRDDNRTIPPSLWFISNTYMGRLIKVVFVELENGDTAIKTAYDPNEDEKYIYHKFSIPL